jgi:copper oxidase (laccase) domain-containing protein
MTQKPHRIKKNFQVDDTTAWWGQSHETSLLQVWEANRRFMELTNNDAQAARTLTLAWATLETRGC